MPTTTSSKLRKNTVPKAAMRVSVRAASLSTPSAAAMPPARASRLAMEIIEKAMLSPKTRKLCLRKSAMAP